MLGHKQASVVSTTDSCPPLLIPLKALIHTYALLGNLQHSFSRNKQTIPLYVFSFPFSSSPLLQDVYLYSFDENIHIHWVERSALCLD